MNWEANVENRMERRTPIRRHPALLFLVAVLGIPGLVMFLGAPRPSAASAPTLRLVAPAGAVPAQAPVTVELQVLEAGDLGAWEFTLIYDRDFLSLAGMEMPPDLGNDRPQCDPAAERCVLPLGPRTAPNGTSLGAVSYGGKPGLSGKGVLARFHFQPTGRPGTTTLSMSAALVTDTRGQAAILLLEPARLVLGSDSSLLYLPLVKRE